MITADKRPLLGRALGSVNRRMLRRHFNGVHVDGAGPVQQLDRSVPIVLFGNHSCWWDGLLEFYFSVELFRFDAYLMMEEKQLARYRFFRWIGAFGVRREVAREAVASLRYAAGLLGAPNRVLWIYPQGEMRPNDRRPLGFATGVGRLAELLGRVQLVPVAHRYEFLMQQRPEAYTLFGAPREIRGPVDPKALTAELESALSSLLDGLRDRIARGDLASFTTLLRGRSSANTVYDAVRGTGVGT